MRKTSESSTNNSQSRGNASLLTRPKFLVKLGEATTALAAGNAGVPSLSAADNGTARRPLG